MQNADPNELEKFSQLAHRWWDTASEFRPLHEINQLRLDWIDQLAGGVAGKKVLVMFWKSDCPPCLVEMSGFENIRKAAGAMPIIVVTPTWGKKEQYFLQKPIKNSALILKYKTGFNNALEYFGDPEGGVPYSVMFNEKGIGCISNLGPVNAKVMKDMFNECGK